MPVFYKSAAPGQPPGPISWPRLVVALVIVVALVVGGLRTARDPALADWNKMFLHSFELVLGLVIGLLGGEAGSRA